MAGKADKERVIAPRTVSEDDDLGHLKAQGRIANKDVRSLTELRYDQVVRLFRRAIDEGHIERRGRLSGTHYVLAEKVGN